MAKFVKQAQENLNDVKKNIERSDIGQLDPFGLNPVSLTSNVMNNAEDLSRNFNRLGGDLERFGEDITGVTARREAERAADLQAQAEIDAEAAARHQKRLAENAADFRKKRNAQLAARLASGGRGGMLMNGTTGFSTGSGDLLGGGSGSKTLLGR